MQIDNREQRGVGLSDLALVRRPDLFPGARPFVYFMVYPKPGSYEVRVTVAQGELRGSGLTTLPQAC